MTDVELPAVLETADRIGLMKSLRQLFEQVTSGEEYNKDQVRHAVSLANVMVNQMRLEFDVHRYVTGRIGVAGNTTPDRIPQGPDNGQANLRGQIPLREKTA